MGGPIKVKRASIQSFFVVLISIDLTKPKNTHYLLVLAIFSILFKERILASSKKNAGYSLLQLE